MVLIVVLALFIALGAAANRWGADSRDPRWSLGPVVDRPSTADNVGTRR